MTKINALATSYFYITMLSLEKGMWIYVCHLHYNKIIFSDYTFDLLPVTDKDVTNIKQLKSNGYTATYHQGNYRKRQEILISAIRKE